jgi:peptidoglycan/xylan/chitin deacetylase (PgdA/CDA1 family)
LPLELILNFHGLGEPPDTFTEAERNVWVPVEWFEAIVDALPRQRVGLTFDDGNASDADQALAVLSQRGMTARFFPPTAKIGAPGHVSAEDVLKLSAAGMEIGSHGLGHCDWRTLTDGELHEELTVSRRMLAEIVGADITEAACPFGSYDRRVLRALRSTGYCRVFTCDGGTGSVGSWLSPRTTVHRGRSLQYWLDLAAAGASRRPTPVQLGKRLVKRLR